LFWCAKPISSAVPESVLLAFVIFLGFPWIFLCLIPHPDGMSVEGAIMICGWIGVYSLIWGYGLAAILRFIVRWPKTPVNHEPPSSPQI
jgi:hypothetical protein